MNPLILFDYFYYRIADLHKNLYVLEHQKEFVGILYLSLLQLINIDTLLRFFFSLKLNYIPIIYIIGYLILLTFNFIRYKKIITYSKLNERWKKERFSLKATKNTLVFIYIVLTFVFFIIVTS